MMSFASWIILGVTAGFIGNCLENTRGEHLLPDLFLGFAGAVAGGWLYYSWGPPGVNGLNLISLFVAVIGSLTCLLTYYAIKRF